MLTRSNVRALRHGDRQRQYRLDRGRCGDNYVTSGTIALDIYGDGAISTGEGSAVLSDGGSTNPFTLVTDSDLLVIEGVADLQEAVIEANWLFDPFENPLEFYDVVYRHRWFHRRPPPSRWQATPRCSALLMTATAGSSYKSPHLNQPRSSSGPSSASGLFGGAAWRRRRHDHAA